jgi:predicted RNA-binding protein
MCIATVYIDNKGELEEAMRDVVYIEAENNRYHLVSLMGEKKSLDGKLKSIDFWQEHSVVIEQGS